MTIPSITLNSGVEMPRLGLGTWQIPDHDAAGVVQTAAELGYRMIDTAAFYGNERGIGEGLRKTEVPREQFFVISKVNGRDQGYDAALRACEASLNRLGVDHLDMYLIHWPMPMRDLYVDTWRAFVRLRDEGRVRAIGVSNFTPGHLDRLVAETGVVPAVNQVQLNPRIARVDWRAYAERHGIALQSWSPLGQGGPLLAEQAITAAAKRHGRTPAQIVLRWHLDLGLVPIPKSADPRRLAANTEVFDFALSTVEHQEIAALDGTEIPMDPETFEQD